MKAPAAIKQPLPYSVSLPTGERTHITDDGSTTRCGRPIRWNLLDRNGWGVATYDGVLPIGPMTCRGCSR